MLVNCKESTSHPPPLRHQPAISVDKVRRHWVNSILQNLKGEGQSINGIGGNV